MEPSSPDIAAVRTAAIQMGANGTDGLPAILDDQFEGRRMDGAISTLPEVPATPPSRGPERRLRVTVTRAESSPVLAGRPSRSRSRDRHDEERSQEWMREVCAMWMTRTE